MRMRNLTMAAVAILALSASGADAQGIPVIDQTAILKHMMRHCAILPAVAQRIMAIC